MDQIIKGNLYSDFPSQVRIVRIFTSSTFTGSITQITPFEQNTMIGTVSLSSMTTALYKAIYS